MFCSASDPLKSIQRYLRQTPLKEDLCVSPPTLTPSPSCLLWTLSSMTLTLILCLNHWTWCLFLISLRFNHDDPQRTLTQTFLNCYAFCCYEKAALNHFPHNPIPLPTLGLPEGVVILLSPLFCFFLVPTKWGMMPDSWESRYDKSYELTTQWNDDKQMVVWKHVYFSYIVAILHKL